MASDRELFESLYPNQQGGDRVYVAGQGASPYMYMDEQPWREETDRYAQTAPAPAIRPQHVYANTGEHVAAPDAAAGQVIYRPKAADGDGQANQPAKWPVRHAPQLEPEVWWKGPVRAVKRLGMVAVLLGMGAFGLKGWQVVSQAMNTTQPQGNYAPEVPYGTAPTLATSTVGVNKPAPAPTTTPSVKTKPSPTVTAAPAATPTATQPPAPTSTPNSPPPAPQGPSWGETMNAQTYNSQGGTSDGNNGTLGVLVGDQTNTYICQTGGFDKLQNPPQNDGAYVMASNVYLLNGPNSLPYCGTANAASQAAALALVATHFAPAVWRQDL